MTSAPDFSINQNIEEHYDVIVLGAQIPALVSAALCARQGLRVAVLGQAHHAPTYRLGSIDAPTSLPLLAAPGSDLGLAVQRELSLGTQFSQTASLGVCSPTKRMDLSGTDELIGCEIEREFPGQRETWTRWMNRSEQIHAQSMTSLSASKRTSFSSLSAWLRDVRTHFDRPHAERTSQPPPPPPEGEGLWKLATAFYRFSAATHVSNRKTEQDWEARGATLYRHLQGNLIDPVSFGNELLLRIERAGGTVQLGWSAKLIVRRASNLELPLRQQHRILRCSELISGCDIERFTNLFEEAPDGLTELSRNPRTHLRFVLNAVCERGSIPTVVPHQLIAYDHPDRADVHLVIRALRDGNLLVSAEQLFSLGHGNTAERIDRARDDLLDYLFEIFPDLEAGLLVVDSPHDGRLPAAYTEEQFSSSLDLWSRGPQFAKRLSRAPHAEGLRPRALRLGTNLWSVGDESMAGFGFDGAASVAHEISRACEHHQPRRFRRHPLP